MPIQLLCLLYFVWFGYFFTSFILHFDHFVFHLLSFIFHLSFPFHLPYFPILTSSLQLLHFKLTCLTATISSSLLLDSNCRFHFYSIYMTLSYPYKTTLIPSDLAVPITPLHTSFNGMSVCAVSVFLIFAIS